MNESLLKAISSSLEFILTNPAIFFSEADVQAILYKKISDIPEYASLHDTACSIGLNQFGDPSGSMYKTNLLHREYGVNDGKGSRVDIAILNPSDISNITDPINLMTISD